MTGSDPAPLVSIVIPCFNAEQTLQATIESALAQDVSKEIIAVDDGSTDGTADILRSFGTDIRLWFGPNRGAGAARNIGTRLARGQFLQYLDSDDLLTPGALTARLAVLQSCSGDVAYADWQEIREQADGCWLPGPVRSSARELTAPDIELATATSQFWAPPAALLYRRSIVAAIGAWREDLRIIQDARFLFDAARCGARFVRVAGIGAFYRVRSNSLSRRSSADFVAECGRNAAEIERLWLAGGSVTAVRAGALYEMWRHVALATAIDGLDGFTAARIGHNRFGPRRWAIEIAWLLRACCGKRCSAAMLRRALQLKAALRQNQFAHVELLQRQ